jgi:zinc protease
MLRTVLAAGFILGLAACAPQSEAPKSETEAAAPAFSIDYEKFTLDNGLEVVLHVDKSDPIVAFTTVVNVGSAREKPGRTGFAHFFEHMAFNDSENVPRGWNRKAIPEWGGQRNGGTWSDGTIYYEVVPKDAFERILWIDSDRLGYMINTVTQAALDREKQVVKNEKRQRVDNAPYGYTQEVIRTALYPEGHPYSWTVIGSLPDLQAATLEDLREFYDQYYGAANATFVIAGDIDIEETKAKVEQWFGEIRRGPDVEPLPPMPVALSETKSLYFEDNFAKLPELRLTFPTVEGYHADEPALNVLAELIAGSRNSALYREIVANRKLAPNVSAYNNSMLLAGEFVFRVRANAGADLDEVKAGIDAALADFEANGVDPLDLQRIKAEQETILYSGISTVLGKSNQMATDNEFAGDPAYAIKASEKLRALTAEDIMAAYETYLKGKPFVMTSFVPKGQADLAVEGAELASVWIEEVRADVASEMVTAGEIASYEKTPSKYDRSMPEFGELPLVKTPEIITGSLDNGVSFYGLQNTETPLVQFDITFEGGAMLDPDGQEGVGALLASLMNEGSATRTPAEMEQAIGLLGSGISASVGTEEFTISGTTLSRNLDATVDLLVEILSQPRFVEEDFARVKSATLTQLEGRNANPTAIASNAFNKLLYGEDHRRGTSTLGTADTVGRVGMSDLEAYHQAMLGAGARVHIAGAFDEDEAKASLNKLAALVRSVDVTVPEQPTPDSGNAGKVFFIDVPGSKQSVLYIGKLTVPGDHPDVNRLEFANEKLGGGISGDLAQTLRIEKGYTYGAYSRISGGEAIRPFSASSSVRANATAASLEIIRNMLSTHGETYTEDDAETMRSKLIKETTRAFESLGAKRGILRDISKYDRPLDFIERDQQALLGYGPSDVAEMFNTWLNEDEMIYVIVGDGATQLEPVRAFAGGEVTVLDIYGDVVE